MPIPRLPAEIIGGDGYDVLEGKAKVVNIEGVDVTREFVKGACKVLEILQSIDAEEAWLIEKSPSCGCGRIFDGTFPEKFKDRDGVTTALLKQNGIQIISIKTTKNE